MQRIVEKVNTKRQGRDVTGNKDPIAFYRVGSDIMSSEEKEVLP